MTREDIEKIRIILNEMPQYASGMDNTDLEMYSSMPIEELVNRTGDVSIFNGVNVRVGGGNDIKILFFIEKEILIAAYAFRSIKKWGIKTVKSWGNPNHRRSFYKIFVNFLIPNFKRIESDDMLTTHGFNFWKRLMDNNRNLNFYVKSSNFGIQKLNDSSELENFIGADIRYKQYSYIVTVD